MIDITGFTAISWSIWAQRSDDGSEGQRAFSIQHSGGDDIRTWLLNDGSSVTVDDGTAYDAALPNFNTDTWYHYVGTFDGSTVRSYQDGELKNETSGASFDFSTASGSLAIGANANDGATLFEGNIDDVGVWSRALSLGEIEYLYNNGDGNVIPEPSTALLLALGGLAALLRRRPRR